MLPSTGQRISLALLSATLVFLLVMNMDINVFRPEAWKRNKEPAPLKMESAKLERKNSKPGGKKSKLEKQLFFPGLETSRAPFIHTNKLDTYQPKTNIVFIKTFKTAGSTLTNILSRFAMKHNLSIHGHEGCLYPELFYRECPLRDLKLNYSTLGKSNMISEHISYNRLILSDIMPNDTVYVTQLRHPLAQLFSRLNFRGYSKVVDPIKRYRSLKDFGASTTEYKHHIWDPWRQLNIPHNVTQQQFEFFLTQVENEFDLVTITEQFDLSLLLLRRKLCWDISDMIYVKLKTANYDLNNNSALLNESNKEIFNKRYQIANPNAYNLYSHFNRTLTNLIIQEGPDLQQELIFFQNLRQNVSKYCSKYIQKIALNLTNVSFHLPFSDVLQIPSSKWGKAHTVDPVDCAMMKLHRMTFQDISAAKFLNKDLILKRTGNVADEKKKIYYFSLTEPVHPKYGIPLPVLKHAQAYDLNEGVFPRGRTFQMVLKAQARKGQNNKM